MQNSFLARLGPALVFSTAVLFGQTPAAAPQFEVASVKPAPPLDRSKLMAGKLHIGMSIDAARVDIGNLSLKDLIQVAYGVKPHQVAGPDWMSIQRWDVMAKMPQGATREQVPEMLQALLAERFKLTVHRDSKEDSVYALVVGKDGPKLKESIPEPDAPAGADSAGAGTTPSGPAGRGGMLLGTGENQVRVNQSGDGKGATVSGGPMGQMKMAMGEGGAMRMEFGKMTMPLLADMLTRFTDRPVVDMTELKGNYQVELDLSMEEMRNVARASGMAGAMTAPPPGAGGEPIRVPADAASTPSGNSIFSAVQQLGLKLEPRKAPIEIIVIHHLEKMPTEN